VFYRRLNKQIIRLAAAFAFALIVTAASAQSSNQDLPTPVRSNEISGAIRALDVGDPRLTHHFYAFNGTHGDLLITVESTNLNGDVDVFTAVTLKPLMKVPMYAGAGASLTTKSIYMRAEEILILRIEARSPNDDDGRYRIRFGGAFAAFSGGIPVAENEEETETSSISRSTSRGTRRVNSVGASINEPVVERPSPSNQPTPASATAAEASKPETKTTASSTPPRVRSTTPRSSRSRPPVTASRSRKGPTPSKPKPDSTAGTAQPTKTETETPVEAQPKPSGPPNESRRSKTNPPKAQDIPAPPGTHLIIEEKDGTRIDHPMVNVRRIMIDNGQIVIFFKSGRIERVSMTNVVRMAIEP
jgi:hypothetical protein